MNSQRPLVVNLLGRIEATIDGRPIRLGGRHAQALFALLCLEPRGRSRDAIAADLWPDAGAASGGSLRQALWLVRSALGDAGVDPDALLDVDGETVGIRQSPLIDLDVRRFEAASRTGDGEAAARLYRGDLAECLGHDCFAAERERLSDLYEDVLAELGSARLDAGDPEGAAEAAAALLGRDPLREEAHATLIAVHGAIGSRSQVVRQYRRLREVLRHELDVEPLPETEAAYRLALATTVERSRRAAAVFARPSLAPVLVARG